MNREIDVKVLLAAFLITTAFLQSSPARADDFGCKVILCLAAPVGLQECASTLNKLKRRLAKGKGFPSCNFSEGGGGGAPPVQTEKGRASWVPVHEVCTKPVYKDVKISGKKAWESGARSRKMYVGCDKSEKRGGYFDHERSCSQIFPIPSHVRYKDRRETSQYRQQQKCRSKSKSWVRVTGEGIDSEYHYY